MDITAINVCHYPMYVSEWGFAKFDFKYKINCTQNLILKLNYVFEYPYSKSNYIK